MKRRLSAGVLSELSAKCEIDRLTAVRYPGQMGAVAKDAIPALVKGLGDEVQVSMR
jgi:hypothetical protein